MAPSSGLITANVELSGLDARIALRDFDERSRVVAYAPSALGRSSERVSAGRTLGGGGILLVIPRLARSRAQGFQSLKSAIEGIAGSTNTSRME